MKHHHHHHQNNNKREKRALCVEWSRVRTVRTVGGEGDVEEEGEKVEARERERERKRERFIPYVGTFLLVYVFLETCTYGTLSDGQKYGSLTDASHVLTYIRTVELPSFYDSRGMLLNSHFRGS